MIAIMATTPSSSILFAYGTLVFPEIWRRVTGDTEARHSERATLEGFALLRVRDAPFPGIVPEKSAPAISGVLYFDLDEEVLTRLDAYEDSFYERVTVRVLGEHSGAPILCQTYIVPTYLREHILTDEPWTIEDFEARHLEDFSRRLRAGFPGNG
jgi:gamma-glutamylcyclotransferase (GGCT)/AIG2-like uncharacterized protein YtfP